MQNMVNICQYHYLIECLESPFPKAMSLSDQLENPSPFDGESLEILGQKAVEETLRTAANGVGCVGFKARLAGPD